MYSPLAVPNEKATKEKPKKNEKKVSKPEKKKVKNKTQPPEVKAQHPNAPTGIYFESDSEIMKFKITKNALSYELNFLMNLKMYSMMITILWSSNKKSLQYLSNSPYEKY